ncbi:hypothetical protein ACMXYX_05400 [Neptuniibacter sp. QD72_48]|uniref:hypothetical protein n=1 Tax=unclassified Neptuniibacter TaxID=2630693 RepID=UPI0039F67C3D
MTNVFLSLISVLVNLFLLFIYFYLLNFPANFILSALSIGLALANIYYLMTVKFKEVFCEYIRAFKAPSQVYNYSVQLTKPENSALRCFEWKPLPDNNFFTTLSTANNSFITKRVFADRVNSLNIIGLVIITTAIILPFVLTDISTIDSNEVVSILGLAALAGTAIYLAYAELRPKQQFHINNTGIYKSSNSNLLPDKLQASNPEIQCLQVISHPCKNSRLVIYYQLNAIKHGGQRILLLENQSRSTIEEASKKLSELLSCEVVKLK